MLAIGQLRVWESGDPLEMSALFLHARLFFGLKAAQSYAIACPPFYDFICGLKSRVVFIVVLTTEQ